MFRPFFVVLMVAVVLCVNWETSEAKGESTASKRQFYEVDDMVLTREQKAYWDSVNSGRTRRAAMKHWWVWPDGVIPYTFERTVGSYGKRITYAAMRHWTKNTCIRFRRKNRNDRYWVEIKYDDDRGACRAHIGWTGKKQNLWIGQRPREGLKRWCTSGKIVHELGHTVGFFHEHNRQDRDRYVSLNKNNIVAGAEGEFDKVDHQFVDSRRQGYDYDSVMHYTPQQGAVAWNRPTMRKVGQGRLTNVVPEQLSAGDLRQVELMYDCTGTKHNNRGKRAAYH